MKPVKTLLFATYAFPPPFDEGSINYQYNLLANIAGFRTTILCPKPRDPAAAALTLTADHQLIQRRYLNRFRRFGLIVGLPLLMCDYVIAKLRGKAEVMGIGYIYPLGLIALLAKLLFGQKYFVIVYAEELPVWARRSRLKRLAMGQILRFADQVVTVSDYSIDVIRSMFDYPRERITKILPAVRFSAKKGAATRRTRPTLLTVSRLEERKGQDVVIRALPFLTDEFPDLHYVICGKGPYEPQLRELARQTGVEARVTFAGFVSEAALPGFYEEATIFILANRELANGDTEGCPTVLIEASAYGIPVIAGHFGGTADAVLDGQTGDLVDSTDPRTVAEAIRRLLRDKSLASRYGREGIAYALSCTPEKQGQKAAALLTELASS